MPPRATRPLPPGPAPHDETVTCPDGRTVRLRVTPGPAAAAEAAPLVLHFHGGFFVGGGLDDTARVAGLLADAGATVISVAYPLAPAHPFPQAVEAGHAALRWLDRERRRLGHARSPIFVAGEEAGGNLAAAAAMVARDRAGPPLAGQVLLSPMLDACVATASQRDAKAGPVGCPCADGWHAYLAQDDDMLHPYAVPARSLRLAGLPPTLLVSAADDPLRDETQAFHARLREAGVAASLLLLDAPTGWPQSYARGDPSRWAGRLREPLRSFLRSPGEAHASRRSG